MQVQNNEFEINKINRNSLLKYFKDKLLQDVTYILAVFIVETNIIVNRQIYKNNKFTQKYNST